MAELLVDSKAPELSRTAIELGKVRNLALWDGGATVSTACTAASLIVNCEPEGWHRRLGPHNADMNIAAGLK